MIRSDLKVVILGRQGQVAQELRRCWSPVGTVTVLARPEIDFQKPDSLRAALRQLRPEVVINAAAFTEVDRAEIEPELAMRVNADAPAAAAEEAKRLNALFVTYSSDYVFDGCKESPYSELDTPNPLGVYGSSKLAGDRAVEAVGGAYLIFRTSWVFGAHGKNFFRSILRLASERDALRVVDDQIGAPTWSRDIAHATLKVVAQLTSGSPLYASARAQETLGDRRGIYNMTSQGAVSWCGFASAIVEETRGRRISEKEPARIVPIPTAEYPTPARRPKNSRLSNAKLYQTFGITLPEWRASLTNVMDEIIEEKPANLLRSSSGGEWK